MASIGWRPGEGQKRSDHRACPSSHGVHTETANVASPALTRS